MEELFPFLSSLSLNSVNVVFAIRKQSVKNLSSAVVVVHKDYQNKKRETAKEKALKHQGKEAQISVKALGGDATSAAQLRNSRMPMPLRQPKEN